MEIAHCLINGRQPVLRASGTRGCVSAGTPEAFLGLGVTGGGRQKLERSDM